MEGTEVRRILCYGDSNTYGYDPRDGGRYDEEHRWPDVLAAGLGGGFEVLAQGMNGREIDLSKPPAQDISGIVYTRTLARSMPLDLLILFLGSNNIAANAEAGAITEGLSRMVRQARQAAETDGRRKIRILLIGPPVVPEGGGFPFPYRDRQRAVSRELPGKYRELAAAEGCAYLDANDFATVSPWDGEHLTPDGHTELGRGVLRKVREIFSLPDGPGAPEKPGCPDKNGLPD